MKWKWNGIGQRCVWYLIVCAMLLQGKKFFCAYSTSHFPCRSIRPSVRPSPPTRNERMNQQTQLVGKEKEEKTSCWTQHTEKNNFFFSFLLFLWYVFIHVCVCVCCWLMLSTKGKSEYFPLVLQVGSAVQEAATGTTRDPTGNWNLFFLFSLSVLAVVKRTGNNEKERREERLA